MARIPGRSVLPIPIPKVTIASLTFTDRMIEGQLPVAKSSFPIGTTSDLYIGIGFLGMGATTKHTIYIFAPDGSFYQRIEVPVSEEAARHGGARTDQNGPLTVVWTSLPIAGSYITQYNLTGRWRVDLVSQTDPSPLATGTFELY